MKSNITSPGNEKDRVEIDIRPLKNFVRDNYPSDHPFQIIQDEDDIIRSVEEFLAKVSIWLKLAEL